jgi:hypothetical protein
MIPRAVGVLAFVALVAVGIHETRADDGDALAVDGVAAPIARTETATSAPDLGRYCELREQLTRAAIAFFREQRGNGGEVAGSAGRQFLQEQASALTEIRQTAPAAVREDVHTFVQGSRAFFRGADAGPTRARSNAAERRLAAFEKRSCDA